MDFVSSAVPPLIPGDIHVRNVTVDKTSETVKLVSLPTYPTSALPSASTIAVGTLVMDTTTGSLKYVSTSGTWLSVTAT